MRTPAPDPTQLDTFARGQGRAVHMVVDAVTLLRPPGACSDVPGLTAPWLHVTIPPVLEVWGRRPCLPSWPHCPHAGQQGGFAGDALSGCQAGVWAPHGGSFQAVLPHHFRL